MGTGSVSRTGSVKMAETVDLAVRDKVFINLMVCEAKRLSELLFLSRAIYDY